MPTVQRVAQIFGAVFILVGVVGLFTPGGMSMGVDQPGMILGLFPVNILHNIVHLLFGVWGLMAGRTFSGAQSYARIGGVIYLVLAICGIVAPTTFGLLPNGGADVWLHAVLGLALAVVGFTAKEAMPAARNA